ncbi:hypothetical protein PCANB_002002 [Pneumocystis canis]|nr:hypothetical protein PCK1_001969 [Pneumocystis canis]KAG5439428.1 hypothetical protein PCANB_002002 [Pneumocystis canis]
MVSLENASFKEVLDDLSVRFIVNLPEEELGSVARICFQIEQAHWYYEDFIRELNPKLPSMHLRTFCLTLFAHCPLLWKWNKNQEKAYNDFLKYKIRVPVRGAIMLNDACEECVLVKGWKNSSRWGFPKGKINKDELDTDCAIREVFEETGFDISERLQPKDYIEITLREQNIRLYIITNVPKDTNFATRTRKEISKIKWHKLENLPTYFTSKEKNNHKNKERSSHKYYLVAPFLEPLLKWIHRKRKSCLNSPKATDEFIISDFEVNQSILKKNSEALKALLGISSYSSITTPFDIASKPESPIKEKSTSINDNKNIFNNEQEYNMNSEKNNLTNILYKELEEKRDKDTERIMELLRNSMDLDLNKTNGKESIVSCQINDKKNFLKYQSEKSKTSVSHSEVSSVINFPKNIAESDQVSISILDKTNITLNYNSKNSLNKETPFSILSRKEKEHNLETNLSQKKNLDIKNDKTKTIESTDINEQLMYLCKLEELKKRETSLSSQPLLTSCLSSVMDTGGTAIDELDAQLLCYLKNVLIKANI